MRQVSILGLFLMSLFASSIVAQTYRVSGHVKDATSGESLPGTSVFIKTLGKGDVADAKGNFSIEGVPGGSYVITARFFGYEENNQDVAISGPTDVEFELQSTTVWGKEVVIEANRAEERKTPVAFTTVDREEISKRYNTQDVPDLVKHVPGVFTSNQGLGESEIYVRGFDGERVQIMINGIPTNDPESQVVYWSNWSGLSSSASSIQIQRGVGSSLVGSGAFGGSVNIQTAQYPVYRTLRLRNSVGGYFIRGIGQGNEKLADGTGGLDTYNPFQQTLGIEYVTGQMYGGKLNLKASYERKSGDSYIKGTGYNGHSIFLGAQSILGNHLVTFNFIGAPQRHNQASSQQDENLLYKLGREYNRYAHPYQENYYFKPQFELHDTWAISDRQLLNINAFLTFGRGGGRYLRNDVFDVNSGKVDFKTVLETTDRSEYARHARYLYENFGFTTPGYNPTTNQYTYNSTTINAASGRHLIASQFGHSWRNDSRNYHDQFGFNGYYQHKLHDMLTVTVGGEWRYWNATHDARSFDFRYLDPTTGAVSTYEEVEKRYDYDGIVTNVSGFGRLLITPVENLTLMLDGQLANYSSRVSENPIRAFDFGTGQFTNFTYRATRDLKDSTGAPVFSKSDYKRSFTFFMPKFGVNYNVNEQINVFANYSIAKKEPKVGDWYSRSAGPGAYQPKDVDGDPIDLDPEVLTNIEFGVGYEAATYGLKANYYIMSFEDKIESVTNQIGERVTINAGEATHQGLELEAHGHYQKYDGNMSLTLASNEWKKMNVQEIFGVPAANVKGKVVPFVPETMFNAEVGYRPFKDFRASIGTVVRDGYYATYDNREYDVNDNDIGSSKLPTYMQVNASFSYQFVLSGTKVSLRWDLINLLNRDKNYERAIYGADFGRNDAFNGVEKVYIVPSPLFHTFFTTEFTF